MSETLQNSFTHGPLGRTYIKTAVPIIFVMAMNGLLSVADALFLGAYVGPQALAAVTLMFPIYMLIVALSTLVATGMSSLIARFLGAEDLDQARAVFAGAHGLALTLGAGLIALFFLVGKALVLLVAGGAEDLTQMGLTYLRITVIFSPMLFILSVNSDALRNEGRVGFMALMSLFVSLTNIGFNYVLIAMFDMGVAGSAYGTVAAQAIALAIIISFRIYGNTPLRLRDLWQNSLSQHWGRILVFGAPQSLSFLGLALNSAAIIVALGWSGTQAYADTVSAYGILTRVMTFAYLPLLGLSFAMQTITGNIYGAKLFQRADTSLRIALGASLVYCVLVQGAIWLMAGWLGALFVDDPKVIAQVARIAPIMSMAFFLTGPILILASYFQAIGSAARAAVLALSKPYCFALPLTLLLPLALGEIGVWIAGPTAEFMVLFLALAVLRERAKREHLSWGLFQMSTGETA
jgi:putative MATE family efflux protein